MTVRDFLPIAGWSLTSDLPLELTFLALQTVTAQLRAAPELPNYTVCLSGSPLPDTTDVFLKMTYRSASELRVLPAAAALRSSSHFYRRIWRRSTESYIGGLISTTWRNPLRPFYSRCARFESLFGSPEVFRGFSQSIHANAVTAYRLGENCLCIHSL